MTNNSMIEKMARAICALNGREPDRPYLEGRPQWTLYTGQARAALTALQEPTEAMLRAAQGFEDPESATVVRLGPHLAKLLFSAMIKAALEEGD